MQFQRIRVARTVNLLRSNTPVVETLYTNRRVNQGQVSYGHRRREWGLMLLGFREGL